MVNKNDGKAQFEFISTTQLVRVFKYFYAAIRQEGTDLFEHLTHMTAMEEQVRDKNEKVDSNTINQWTETSLHIDAKIILW